MADGIVDRLNSSHAFLGDPLHKEAADEIERLRSEIAHDRDQRLAVVVAVVRQCEITLSLPHWFEDKIRAAFAQEPANG